MLSCMLFFCLLPCLANDWVLSVSDPHELPSGGTWNRPFPTPKGWKIFLGGSAMRIGDLIRNDATWTVENIRVISDRDGQHFNDHAVKKCPDGSFLHMASYDYNNPNDSAHVWRYDEDFSILHSTLWEEGSRERQYNDGSILCSRLSQGIASSTMGGPMDFGNHYFSVDEEGEKGELVVLADYPRLNGGALFADEDLGVIYHLGMDHGRPLQVNVYDRDWNQIDEKLLDLYIPPKRSYWPQGIIRVGDYYMLTFMGRNDSWGNGDLGDVFLAILDQEWNVEQIQQVTNYERGFAMRPWIARQGDQVIIAYDGDLKFFVVELQIDLKAFGLSSDSLDTGLDPTLWDFRNERDCGCGGENAAVFFLFTCLIPWIRREPNGVSDQC